MGMFSIRSNDMFVNDHCKVTRHILRHVNPDTQELEGRKIALFDVYCDGMYLDSLPNIDEAIDLCRKYYEFYIHASGAIKYDPSSRSFSELILNG